MTATPCTLCDTDGGEVIFRHPLFRVIDALDANYPGFLRVVWNAHVREFSELTPEQRALCMDVVVCLEQFVLAEFKADKANLATLGNVVPHVHWHVIPRFTDDPHFPAPVWAALPEGAMLSPRQAVILESQSQWKPRLAAMLGQRFPF